jgi:trehalose 6-phosphate synthase/phosphatase
VDANPLRAKRCDHVTAMPRLILVSNRLPVSARVERGELMVAPSAGGLATGLSGLHASGESLWIGWPGETWRLSAEQRADLQRRLAENRCVPVELTAGEIERYYEGFSNGVLWPLLHYELERLPMHPSGWESYRDVNERFADAVVAHYQPGDRIWVHDYQLLLVPGMVRRRLPDAIIGFFLHVPFPTSELFRVLTWRRELLEGMLGATLVGFHAASYAAHFISSASKILGCETGAGHVRIEGRRVRVGDFPMGIDASAYEALAGEPSVQAETDRVRRAAGDVRLIVAVDRLDYTKGIPRRLLTFERLLEHYPSLRGRVRLVQVAAPSRETVSEYRELRRSVEELVGRLNGRFASVGYDPINYISRTLSRERLVALYRAATVALITPLRDGMNLVAKEFVASRTDEDGVLVLSEFAGASTELSGALLVNPYDIDGVAVTLRHALDMPAAERGERMRGLRQRVREYDVHRWARDFENALKAEERRAVRGAGMVDPLADAVSPSRVVAALQPSGRAPLVLLLDYDGTLVPLRPTPEEAAPGEEILHLLSTLAGLPEVSVHVVSGRTRASLERWLGHLPLGLHAEHGLWSRYPGESEWHRRIEGRPEWLDALRPRLEAWSRDIAGSFVEEKEASIAWHYRKADVRAGGRAANRLRRELARILKGSGASVLSGNRVVEVRHEGIHKGLLVDALREMQPWARVLIVGDDVTDEDMFAAAPPDAVTVRVGPGRTKARFRVAGPDQVRAALAEIAASRGAQRMTDGGAKTAEPREPTMAQRRA